MDWLGIIGALTVAIIAIIKVFKSDAEKTEKIDQLTAQNKAQEERLKALEKACADCHEQRRQDREELQELRGEKAAEQRIADQMQGVLDARKDSDRRFWVILFNEHSQKMKAMFDKELGRIVRIDKVENEEKLGDTLEA